MRRSIRFLVIVIVAQISLATVAADELWTYYFVANGSRPYYRDCFGDCSSGGMHADLAGTFSILLNWQTGTGKLFTLDDQLVNVAFLNESGSLAPTVPSFRAHGLYVPGGSPEFAEGTFTYGGGSGRLVSDGLIPLPGGLTRLGTPYDISFGLTNATLSLSMPHVGGNMLVTAAPATLINAIVAGDSNHDNRVDARDYVLSRKSGGSQTEYSLWRMLYGSGRSAVVGQAAPEPSSIFLLGTAAVVILNRRRKSVPHNRV